MAELVKVLYGDGETAVTAKTNTVDFNQYGALITISHATMREIMLSWTRHELREKE